MAVRVAINGFGRIGRQSLKALLEREIPVEVVAVNDLADASMNAHLFKHDSTYGAYRGVVEHTEDAVIVDGRAIKVLAEPDPTKLPWADLGVDIVLESTGKFRHSPVGERQELDWVERWFCGSLLHLHFTRAALGCPGLQRRAA